MISGDARIDETSRSGLETLSRTLDQRTSFSPGDPVGVDVAARRTRLLSDALLADQRARAAAFGKDRRARRRLYEAGRHDRLRHARRADAPRANATPTPEALWLRELAKGLDIPELEIVPRDHVITKTFYLLDGFVGRYANGDTWVEALPPEPDQ